MVALGLEEGCAQGEVLCPFDHGVHLMPPCCDFLRMEGINEKTKI